MYKKGLCCKKSYVSVIHKYLTLFSFFCTGLRSAVGNVSGNRWESDRRSRGRKFYPGLVPYFRGD